MSASASASQSQPLSAEERAVIVRAVSAFPPLTESTKATLAALFRGARRTDPFADKLRATINGGAR